MPFINFFWRDFKSDKSFNWFYVLCASLGILGLLLVESFKIGVEDKVSQNAKNFIASDLSVSSRREFSPLEKTNLLDFLTKNKMDFALWVETYSLISKAGTKEPSAKLANLNFVSEQFPFYGGVVLEENISKQPGQWSELHSSPVAWISRDLAWELDLKKGEVITIGEKKFIVGGIIVEDKFSSFRGFSLAPKIFVSYSFLKDTDLIKFGSTATHAYAIKFAEGTNGLFVQQELKKLLKDSSIKIKGPKESSEQISRSLLLLADYLSLITLLTYLLSLIGLYYFSQHFLSGKLKVFSVYKAMGVKTSFLFRVNFLHLVSLSLAAVVFSTLCVEILLPFIERFFEQLVNEDLIFRLSISSIIRILTLSFGGSMLALGPLYWGALQTPVALVFQDLPAELKRIRFYYFLPLLVYVIVLAMVLANSYKVGGLFVGALLVIVLLSAFIFKLCTWSLDKSSKHFGFISRQSVKTLSRYFTSSFTVFICLLLGMTLTTFIFQLEKSLRSEFTQTYDNKRPDLFTFDLQDSQYEEFQRLTRMENWNLTLSAPMVRARLIKINNLSTSNREESDSAFSTREDENSQRIRNRGVNLSFRNKLSWSETIVEGKFNPNTCKQTDNLCEISLEQSYARRLGVNLGDKLLFDVSGIEVGGVVTSLRRVKWTSFEPNFFILFQPGAIDEAPKTYLSSFKAPSVKEKRQIFSKIATTFPNVSILDVSEVIRKITTIFDLMAVAIKFISVLSLMLALVVLVAVSFNHLELRKREMNLFRMLGLKNTTVASIYICEFGILISLCVILSLVFGSLMTLILMKNIFDAEAFLRPEWVIPFLIGLGVILLLIVTGRVKYLLIKKLSF